MKSKALFVIPLFLLAASPAFADPQYRTVSVSGEASEEVAPDRAVLSGQLVSKAKELAAAKEANDKQAETVLAVASKFDIPREKVSASNATISPEYNYNNETKAQELVGYVASRSLSITMDKMDIHERVLSALVANGIDQINGVAFTVANPDERADKLRARAVQNARARAQLLAEAAGARLGNVVSISMDGAMPPPVPMVRSAMAKSAAPGSSVAPSLPGTETLSERVSVTFALD